MKMKAAVLWAPGQPLVIEDVDLEGPREHEVLVKVIGSGVCGTDAHVVDGDVTMYGLPVIPGHEVSGEVVELGSAVTTVSVGDPVLVNLMPGCGWCASCCLGNPRGCATLKPGLMADGTTRLSVGGQPVRQMSNVGGFAEYVVVSERGCIRIPREARLAESCLIGCGVATGWSAVFHAARVTPGASAVVVGCGGVGLNVVQCLRLAGATTIVAVDIVPSKLEMAQRFGATHVINASTTDPVAEVRELTSGGADFGFEVIGRSMTVRQAFDATRVDGTLTIVGVPRPGDEVSLPASIGRIVVNGGWRQIRPWRDFPLLVDLYMRGRLMVDELIDRVAPLEKVNEALADLHAGSVSRTVLTPHVFGS